MSDVEISESLRPWVKEHIALYLVDGEAAHYWDASLAGAEGLLTTLLLTTSGRRTGRKLVLPLIYRPTDTGGYCIIASKGGAPAHPAWYLNLEAEPRVQVKVANDTFEAVARVAQGDERKQLWQRMVDYYPPYTDYQKATDRTIPVVVLDPVK
ncbi:MAG: nitroreductase family deazaflavin-dependent oxidoreductase [Parahaliea sp.]